MSDFSSICLRLVEHIFSVAQLAVQVLGLKLKRGEGARVESVGVGSLGCGLYREICTLFLEKGRPIERDITGSRNSLVFFQKM